MPAVNTRARSIQQAVILILLLMLTSASQLLLRLTVQLLQHSLAPSPTVNCLAHSNLIEVENNYNKLPNLCLKKKQFEF